jgi:hypothetical protein
MEGNKMNRFLEDLKRWGIAAIIGGLLGGVLQFQVFQSKVEYDCKVLKAFRVGDKAYDCKERA